MVASNNTAEKIETPMEKLARLEAENAQLKQQAAGRLDDGKGEFKLGVTEARAEGTRGPKDGGSKGGSLSITSGKSRIFPSVGVVLAMFEHEKEIRAYIAENAGKLSR